MKGRPEQSFLDQFSERFMNHVRQVCNYSQLFPFFVILSFAKVTSVISHIIFQVCTFAKSIPGFKCLHHDDQVSLLKSCVFEVLLVRLSGLFDNQVRSLFIYLAGRCKHWLSISKIIAVGTASA